MYPGSHPIISPSEKWNKSADRQRKGNGGKPIECLVGSILIVTGKPFLGELSYLLKGMKQIQIENVLAIGSVETLDIGVLRRSPRLNELDEDNLSECIENPTQLDANRPLPFVAVLLVDLLLGAPLADRKQQFNRERVNQVQQMEFSQE